MTKQKSPKKKGYKNALILTGIAFEMGAIIYVFVKGGKWLDGHYQNEKGIFTILGTFLGMAISLWLVLRQLKKIEY